MRHVLSGVDAVSELSGKVVSMLILFMMSILLLEVTLRYVFDSPTVWAHQASQQLFAAYSILAGAYILLHHQHVKVDVLYSRLSPRMRAILDSFTYLVFFMFVILLLVYGLKQAMHSIRIMEGPTPPFIIPMWPLRLTVPIGAFLILLQGLAHYVQILSVAIRGRELT